MSANLLPSTLQQLSAILLFALSTFMVAVHSLLILRAAQQATLQRHTRVVAPIVATSFLAVWLGVAISMAAGVNLPLARAQRLAVSLLVGFGPVLAAVVLLLLSRTVSAVYAAMPSEWLIRVQTYRMAGLIFLYPFLYYGVIPAAFAVPAAVGDFLTALLAPVVASAVTKRDSRGFAWAMAWNLFGILDLIVAPTTAVLFARPSHWAVPARDCSAFPGTTAWYPDTSLFAPELDGHAKGRFSGAGRVLAGG